MLTPKQARFVENYLIDLNATQAAIRAGYSEATANQQGPRLLENADVMAAIDAAKIERSEETKIDAVWVLKRLADEATANIADLYDENGDLKSVHEWPLIWQQGLVTGIEIDALFDGQGEGRKQIGVVKKLKLSDRIRRLELIGKHIRVNAFQDQIAVKGLDGLADRMERAMRRGDDPTIISCWKALDQARSNGLLARSQRKLQPIRRKVSTSRLTLLRPRLVHGFVSMTAQ